MTEVVRYSIVCDHPEVGRRYFVADLDDDRGNGGKVHFRIFRGGHGVLVTPANKLGSRTTVPFKCGHCNLNAELQETSVPEVLDKLAPHLSLLPIEAEVVEEPPEMDPGDFYDVLAGTADPRPGVIVGQVERHTISLSQWCAVVAQLRARGKR